MKVTDIIKKIPTGSPVIELLKLATILAATVLADKIGDIIDDAVELSEAPKFIDIKETEE